MEKRLERVLQMPSESMKYALQPVIMALIAKELLRHPDMDVNIAVVCCICEIFTIMVRKTPYSDEQMKVKKHLTSFRLTCGEYFEDIILYNFQVTAPSLCTGFF